MSERYTRIFTLPANLQTEDAPITITSGRLLYDNEKDRKVVVLKFKNVSDKEIESVIVSIKPFNSKGAELDTIPQYTYANLQALSNAEFGNKKAIPVASRTASSFEIEIESVLFGDGSSWSCPKGAKWAPPSRIDEVSVEHSAVQKGSVSAAPVKSDIKKESRPTEMHRSTSNYSHKSTSKRKKKSGSKALIICIAALILGAGIFFGKDIIVEGCKEMKYKKAAVLYEEGNYEEAASMFYKLGDYKNSTDSAQEIEKYLAQLAISEQYGPTLDELMQIVASVGEANMGTGVNDGDKVVSYTYGNFEVRVSDLDGGLYGLNYTVTYSYQNKKYANDVKAELYDDKCYVSIDLSENEMDIYVSCYFDEFLARGIDAARGAIKGLSIEEYVVNGELGDITSYESNSAGMVLLGFENSADAGNFLRENIHRAIVAMCDTLQNELDFDITRLGFSQDVVSAIS